MSSNPRYFGSDFFLDSTNKGVRSLYKNGKFIAAIESTTASDLFIETLIQKITSLQAENELLELKVKELEEYIFMKGCVNE